MKVLIGALALTSLLVSSCSSQVSQSSSDTATTESISSIEEACLAYGKALGPYPSDAPALTSAGLEEWALTARAVGIDIQDIADQTQDVDALVSASMRTFADAVLLTADLAEQTATDPATANSAELGQALQDSASAIADLNIVCFGS